VTEVLTTLSIRGAAPGEGSFIERPNSDGRNWKIVLPSGNTELDVQKDDVSVVPLCSSLNFENVHSVTDEGGGKATVKALPDGNAGDMLYYDGEGWVQLPAPGTVDTDPGLNFDLASDTPYWVEHGFAVEEDGLEIVEKCIRINYENVESVTNNLDGKATVKVLPDGSAGDVMYYDGTAWVTLAAPIGMTEDPVLRFGIASGAPYWDEVAEFECPEENGS
jgi:hypothetical protein